MPLTGPGVVVADDIKATFRATDGDVEQIGPAGCPSPGTGALGIAAEYQDHDVGLLALVNHLDRSCVVIWN
jgi:hypothetical protein